MELLIFGCGYLGRRVADLWRGQGGAVTAVTRRPQHAEALRSAGIAAIVADVTKPRTLNELPCPDVVLYAVGYDRSSGDSLSQVYVGGLENVLHALPRPAAPEQRFLYVSSTGVYGAVDSEWVDEQSECSPQREGGRACLEAEALLRDDPRWGPRSVILRMAGLYGPGRIPRLNDLRAGTPIPSPADGWLNLIQIDDAAHVALMAARHAPLPRVYCVSDGAPVRRLEYFEELCRLAAAPPPRFSEPSDSRRRRGTASKRVRNTRMLAELPIRLRRPSYREGLAELTASEVSRGEPEPE